MKYMFLPFARYFDFNGRSRRLEFWLFTLFNWVLGILFSIAFIALFAGKMFEIAQRQGFTGYGGYVADYYGVGAEYRWVANIEPQQLLAELGPLAVGFGIAYLVYTCLIFTPALAVTVRRLHDTNRTGWWVLIPALLYAVFILLALVAVTTPSLVVVMGVAAGLFGVLAGVSALVLLVFMFIDGTPGPNQYGPSPKHPHYPATFA